MSEVRSPASVLPAAPAAGAPGPALDCATRAGTIPALIRRFDRYRHALPSARAASDLSDLEDRAGTSPSLAPCLTRLPVDVRGLVAELGIPPDALAPTDLRNDRTGFRAALYRDEGSGRLILVARDTQPHSLVDWQTNTRNGMGLDTAQYAAMRHLSHALDESGLAFDLAGYSKGGGLAQEGGLVHPSGQVRVFNSAGLHEASLARTGNTDFESLMNRTEAFSAKDDFLTYMNHTTDPDRRIANAVYLRQALADSTAAIHGLQPISVDYRNPELRAAPDPAFTTDRAAFLGALDAQIANMRAARAAGRPVEGFPPVRAAYETVVADSAAAPAGLLGAEADRPGLGRLMQHRMSQVLGPMEEGVAADRRNLQDFLRQCG